MKKLVFVTLLLATPAMAQQQADQQRLKSFETMQLQRNQAMDAVAYCVGEMQSQVEALKKQLEEAKKACPAKVEDPAK